MSFKVSYENLNSPYIGQAMNKIYNSPLAPKTAFKVGKIKKAIDEELESARKQYQKMLKDSCEVDEKGNILFDESGEPKFKNEDSKKDFEGKYSEFKKIEFEVTQQKIYMPELDPVRISAAEIEALQFCIEN